jgi:DNA-dependent protein kinase catalytic subunit
MQQMNELVNARLNAVVHADASFIRDSSLQVKTYVVTPLTVSMGLVEWVEHAEPLKSVFESEILNDETLAASNAKAISMEGGKKCVELSLLDASCSHQDWLGSYDAASFHSMYKACGVHDSEELFRRMTTQLPADLLRRRLISMSSDSAVFLAVRNEYVRSLAASSIFGYLLGLGDRHLENILLDTRTGGLVHIDFGICFGTRL